MSPNEYQRLALRAEAKPSTPHDEHPELEAAQRRVRLVQGVFGLCLASGEVQRRIVLGKNPSMEGVLSDCGDLLLCLAVTLDAAGYTLEEAMEHNIEKMRGIYPDNFTAPLASPPPMDGQ